MKFAYSNLACPEWTMEEVFDHAVRYGYAGVELRLLDGDVISPQADASVRRRIRKLAADTGVQIIGIGASTHFAMADVDQRSRQVQELLQYLELASDIEAPLVRTFGGSPGPSEDAKTAVLRVGEALRQVSDRAESLGIDVLLETHDGFSSSALVKEALAFAPSPRIGALWDVHHPYRMEESPAETLENLKDRLRHVHIKDAKRDGDGWALVLLGEGEVPVQEIVRRLMESGYDGWLSVEWERKWHPHLQEAHIALPQHLAVLKEYITV